MLRPLATVAAAAAVFLLGQTAANAQLVTYYSPVIAAPVPVVAASPIVPAPVVAAPVTTVVSRPIVSVGAGPVAVQVGRPIQTVAFSPVVAAPAPVAVAPTVVARPVVTNVPVVTTRFRPLLGGSVTRVRYRPVVSTAFVPAF